MQSLFFNKQLQILIWSFVLIIFAFQACKKDNNGNSNELFMRFKANGVLVEYNDPTTLYAILTQGGAQHTGSFTGYDPISTMTLQVYDSMAISVKAYTGFYIVGSVLLGALMSYGDANGVTYSQDTNNNDIVINVSEVTATNVKGTFSGTLVEPGYPNIAMTQGEFNVQRF